MSIRMRMKERSRGRFLSTYGLRKLPGLSEDRYELFIVDDNGIPVSHLTEWYRLRKEPGTNGTRKTYLGMLLPFFGYLLHKGIAWNSEPKHIRAQVVKFLRSDVMCAVRKDNDLDGYR